MVSLPFIASRMKNLGRAQDLEAYWNYVFVFTLITSEKGGKLDDRHANSLEKVENKRAR